MPPKKKKTPRNGFYYFMEDLRVEHERKGGTTFSNKKELADFAGPFWADLPHEEKLRYNEMAKAHKGADAYEDAAHKFTSLGVSFAEQEAEEKDLQEKHHIMWQTIKNTVHPLKKHNLKAQTFFVGHVNHIFKTEADFYAPGEISIVEFSLGDGVINKFHCFIHPGKIPLGLRFEAKDWSDKNHGIPLDWEESEKDYYHIFQRVVNFLTHNKSTDVIPPIYTMPDALNSNYSLKAVQCAIDFLCDESNNNPSLFRIYKLPLLFFELRNKAIEGSAEPGVPSLALIEGEIEKDLFGSLKNLACKFHEDNDLAFICSLSICTRWVYTICDHCCKFLGVDLTEGKHVPADVDTEWSVEGVKKGKGGCIPKTNKPVPLFSRPEVMANKSTPILVEHDALKNKRESERREQEQQVAINEEVRPPRSYASFALNSPDQQFVADPNDFPEIGGTSRGVRRDVPIWPISGRGWSKNRTNEL